LPVLSSLACWFFPQVHRQFVSQLETGPTLRQAAEAHPFYLKSAYNDAVVELERFRDQHRGFAGSFIAAPGSKAGEVGTGGSDFMPALKGYQKATQKHLL
jgi:indoleamine 2,3-dioxygenase